MERIVKPSKIIFIFVVIAVLLSVYGSALYDLQIRQGAAYREKSVNSIITYSTVMSSRGDILDRNGNLLVSSETIYNISISRGVLLRQEDPNQILLTLINTAEKYGASYNDTFPVTHSGSFSYMTDMSTSQRTRLTRYFEFFDLDPEISASDLIVWLKDHYGIGYTIKLADARKIIGVRYELELRVIMNIANAYTFADDVDIEFISVVSEQGLPGVSVTTSSKRVYHTEYAAHILGNVGLMSAEEYKETYEALGYPMNAVVGKNGVELSFEEYLHGENGSEVITTNPSGAVTSVITKSEAESGGNVYLSIDIGMQQVIEDSMARVAGEINATREGQDVDLVEGGAVVVLDVRNSETLAIGSYPTYDLSRFFENYNLLEADPLTPMVNRATMGRYNIGSTFKMVTAYAGLQAGKITPATLVLDKGTYTEYPSYQPKCWISPGSHGSVNVTGALKVSCNYFFYWLGDSLGIRAISNAAVQFGFGAKTGIEIPENVGTVATPEYKQEILGEGWWAADTLLVSIGQGHNMFTPVQLANYVAALANGGTLHSVTLLKEVRAGDYSSVVLEKEPEVLNVIDNSNGYINVIQGGMKAVTAEGGTAASVFGGYPVKVAAKTGTVQSDQGKMNTGVFVCYAPADNPEIAVAVVMEKGGSGSALMNVAKDVLDYYFSVSSPDETLYGEGSLSR